MVSRALFGHHEPPRSRPFLSLACYAATTYRTAYGKMHAECPDKNGPCECPCHQTGRLAQLARLAPWRRHGLIQWWVTLGSPALLTLCAVVAGCSAVAAGSVPGWMGACWCGTCTVWAWSGAAGWRSWFRDRRPR